MSTFLEETNTVTVNGKTQERKFKTTIKVTIIDPAEEYVLLQMDDNNQVIMTQAILPGQAPENLSPAPEAAYLILETHRRNPITGERSVERTLYDREEEQFSTFYPLDNGYFGKQNTDLLWQ